MQKENHLLEVARSQIVTKFHLFYHDNDPENPTMIRQEWLKNICEFCCQSLDLNLIEFESNVEKVNKKESEYDLNALNILYFADFRFAVFCTDD